MIYFKWNASSVAVLLERLEVESENRPQWLTIPAGGTPIKCAEAVKIAMVKHFTKLSPGAKTFGHFVIAGNNSDIHSAILAIRIIESPDTFFRQLRDEDSFPKPLTKIGRFEIDLKLCDVPVKLETMDVSQAAIEKDFASEHTLAEIGISRTDELLHELDKEQEAWENLHKQNW